MRSPVVWHHRCQNVATAKQTLLYQREKNSCLGMYVSRGTTTTCYYSNWEPHHTLTSPRPSLPFAWYSDKHVLYHAAKLRLCCVCNQALGWAVLVHLAPLSLYSFLTKGEKKVNFVDRKMFCEFVTLLFNKYDKHA